MKNFYQEFKTPIVTTIIIFLAFFIYTKFAGPIPFFINSVNTTKTDLFSVDGEGKAISVPDTATVDLGVTEQATTVAIAQTKTNQSTNKIISDIKKLGISDNDIKTTDYSINPNYGNGTYNSGSVEANSAMMPVLPPGGNQQIVGYTVTQNLEIKVKPIDLSNKVIDTATADGANLVGGVTFTFSDELQKSLEKQATQQAVDNAKQKAQTIASASGINLGKIVNVVENSNTPGVYPMLEAGTANSTNEQATPPTNVTPGQNTVTVDVVIYYETY